jgi:oxygen-dependent protoporphyrinogen oxidase
MRVIVIGGGITGLSAAYRLFELSSIQNQKIEIILLEKQNRIGGTIRTEHIDGFLIENGPDSFITTKPWALNLCRRIGLESELIETNTHNRNTFVVLQGKLQPIPEGFFVLAPTRLIPFLKSPLFSWKGKLRILMELFIPGETKDDETLASFTIRRFGREALERVVQPLIGSIYMANPENISLRATLPHLLEMERKHRSLIRAMRKEQGRDKQNQSGARYSLFVSLLNGMQTLPERLASLLPKDTIKLNHSVEGIIRENGLWTITTHRGNRFFADGLIITTPAYITASLLKGLDPDLSKDLSKIHYNSSVVVNLAYRREDISHPLNGFGFVVPATEKRNIVACSFSSIKFQGRAPKGNIVLRCFLGGSIQPKACEWDDSKIIETTHRELSELLHIKNKPLVICVYRHINSMPLYGVGHTELINRIKERVKTHRGLALAGSAYEGVGMPDCIHSGELAAESIASGILNQ